MARVGKDLLKVILLISCRIKTINKIQFFWWLSSVLFWSLTPGSVLAHLPPSVHPSYHASSLCLPFTEGLPCIWVVYFSQKGGVLGQEKNCSPLFLPPFCHLLLWWWEGKPAGRKLSALRMLGRRNDWGCPGQGKRKAAVPSLAWATLYWQQLSQRQKMDFQGGYRLLWISQGLRHSFPIGPNHWRA